jgi:hypothetical protein
MIRREPDAIFGDLYVNLGICEVYAFQKLVEWPGRVCNGPEDWRRLRRGGCVVMGRHDRKGVLDLVGVYGGEKNGHQENKRDGTRQCERTLNAASILHADADPNVTF